MSSVRESLVRSWFYLGHDITIYAAATPAWKALIITTLADCVGAVLMLFLNVQIQTEMQARLLQFLSFNTNVESTFQLVQLVVSYCQWYFISAHFSFQKRSSRSKGFLFRVFSVERLVLMTAI